MPCVYLPGPAPAVTVANNNTHGSSHSHIHTDVHKIMIDRLFFDSMKRSPVRHRTQTTC